MCELSGSQTRRGTGDDAQRATASHHGGKRGRGRGDRLLHVDRWTVTVSDVSEARHSRRGSLQRYVSKTQEKMPKSRYKFGSSQHTAEAPRVMT